MVLKANKFIIGKYAEIIRDLLILVITCLQFAFSTIHKSMKRLVLLNQILDNDNITFPFKMEKMLFSKLPCCEFLKTV